MNLSRRDLLAGTSAALASSSLGFIPTLHAEYDTVIANGRVIDPETKLDAIRYVGIRGAKIVTVSKTPLRKDESLRRRVQSDLAAIQSRPALVRSFFHAPSVAYTRD